MRCAFSWIRCPALALPSHAGGDIACAVAAPDAIRLLIGDVMGHGERAARTAAAVTSMFRELAVYPDPLHVIAARLHAFVAGRDCGEEFVTALLVRVPMDDSQAEIVCCGHPHPLLLRGGQVTRLAAPEPAPPLGLLDLADSCQARAGLLGAGPGDSVLLYTDGVTDARDAAGRPYPLAERAAALSGNGEPLLEALRADLLRHANGVLRDDATMLHLRLAPTATDVSADIGSGLPRQATVLSAGDSPQLTPGATAVL
jgi:serine phosphatase RsbU (regulator of sigma subunit)